MFRILLIPVFVFSAFISTGQTKAYKPRPKARQLEDSAIHLFTKSGGAPEFNPAVTKLLQQAVAIDPKYSEGWHNLLDFQCRTDHMAEGLKTAKKITELFPGQLDALLSYGVLQYVNNLQPASRATFEKLLKQYELLLVKEKDSKIRRGLMTQKGIALILADRSDEGKKLLRQLHSDETDDYMKSFLAFYINSTKDAIIKDKIPGK